MYDSDKKKMEKIINENKIKILEYELQEKKSEKQMKNKKSILEYQQ